MEDPSALFGNMHVMPCLVASTCKGFVSCTALPCSLLSAPPNRVQTGDNHQPMDFRRRLAAQANAAQQTSPAAHPPPVTPRNRPRQSIAIHHSPASTPSISSSVPFDWNAARTRQPAPFSTPRSRIRPSTSGLATPRKAVIRKKSFFQKFVSSVSF